MRPHHSSLTLIFLMGASLPALSAATQGEADQIKTSIEKYVGATPGVISVSPDGDAYKLIFDASPLIKLGSANGVTGSFTPYEVKLQSKGDGTWNVSSETALKFSFNYNNLITYDVNSNTGKWTGVYDANNQVMLSSNFDMQGLDYSQIIKDPTAGVETSTQYKIASMNSTTTSTVTSPGISDMKLVYKGSGFDQALSMKPLEGAQAAAAPVTPFDFNFKSTDFIYDTSAKGLHNKAILSLMSWFVAHPSKELIIKDQAALKALLKDALPFADDIKSEGKLVKFEAATPIGPVAAEALSFNVDMTGFAKNASLREALSIEGLKLPTAALPPWSHKLLTENFKIDFQGSGLNLESTFAAIIDKFDLNVDPPIPEADMTQIFSSIFNAEGATISLNPSFINNPIYALDYSGKMGVTLAGPTSGKATITFKGMDEVIAKLQEASVSDPSAAQAMGPLIGAKGMAKAGADGTLTWELDFDPATKAIKVNGIDVTKMSGAQ